MLDLIKIRKELHEIPETAFEEFKTQEYILAKLRSYRELEIKTFEPTGILAIYSGGEDRYKLFRADMDALAIKEETGCEYPSIHEGKMHACGHDVHMTILLGLLDRVIKEKLSENLLFVFQPAEEGRGGALKILEDDIWSDFDIESSYALHVSPDIKPGTISSRAGNFFAATSEFDINVKGKSSHIATPESGKNALQAGVEIYQCVQQLHKVVKSDEKFICDIGLLQAGRVRNAIPAKCLLSGTIRAEDQARVEALKESLQGICDTVSIAYGVEVDLSFLVDYKEVYNDAELEKLLQKAVEKAGAGYKVAKQTMAGEDFGYFCGRWKGILFWLGAAKEDFYPLHSSHFYPDDSAIETGIDVFYNLISG